MFSLTCDSNNTIKKSSINGNKIFAKQSGIAGFTAEVLRDNRKMQSVFNKCGLSVKSYLEDDMYSFQMDF